MFANERHYIISEIIKKEGAVTTSALVKHFNVSTETIRRDLLTLENQGVLKRVHGGGVGIGEMKSFGNLEKRNCENSELKKELSKTAAALVHEGDIIGIDSGSTAIFFAQELVKSFTSLTIFTHSLDVFNIVCRHRDFSVILCGGHFKSEENSFYGSFVKDTLSSLHADKIFVFPSAISLKNGICDFESDLYEVQRNLIRTGNSIYILADSSKFEKNALLKVDEMRSEYTYVTDSKLPQSLMTLYQENGITVLGGKEK